MTLLLNYVYNFNYLFIYYKGTLIFLLSPVIVFLFSETFYEFRMVLTLVLYNEKVFEVYYK